MPPLYQGTVLRPEEPRILNLDPPPHLRGSLQEQNLAFLDRLNRRHLAMHPGESDLETRIQSYELAAAMQTAAKEALDITGEPESVRRLYGLDQDHTREYGARCLIARRLVERGVRFVQLFLGGQPWDNHSSIRSTLPEICRRTDRPAAALVADLKQRGLLDTTIVHWGGEIGRLPVSEGNLDASAGRDHNGQGFSIWLQRAAGSQGGMTFDATDEVGHRARRRTSSRTQKRLPGHGPAPTWPGPRAAGLPRQRPRAAHHRRPARPSRWEILHCLDSLEGVQEHHLPVGHRHPRR